MHAIFLSFRTVSKHPHGLVFRPFSRRIASLCPLIYALRRVARMGPFTRRARLFEHIFASADTLPSLVSSLLTRRPRPSLSSRTSNHPHRQALLPKVLFLCIDGDQPSSSLPQRQSFLVRRWAPALRQVPMSPTPTIEAAMAQHTAMLANPRTTCDARAFVLRAIAAQVDDSKSSPPPCPCSPEASPRSHRTSSSPAGSCALLSFSMPARPSPRCQTTSGVHSRLSRPRRSQRCCCARVT